MTRSVPAPAADVGYRCGAAARWVSRTLAGTAIVAAWAVTNRFAEAPGLVGSSRFQLALWFGSALFAFWVLQKGAELRIEVVLTDESLVFSYGSNPSALPFREIATLRFEPPFASRRSWIAATAVLDNQGCSWRLPVALERGDLLVSELVRRSGREDLGAWVEALRIEARMRRGKWHVWAAYAAAGAMLAGALAFNLR